MSGVRRVIVGASGSPGSLRALRHAEDLARHSDATLTPVLAWVPPGGDLAARQPCPALIRIWHEAAWQRLWDALEAAWGMVPVDLSVQPVAAAASRVSVLVGIATYLDDPFIVGAVAGGLVFGLARPVTLLPGPCAMPGPGRAAVTRVWFPAACTAGAAARAEHGPDPAQRRQRHRIGSLRW